MWCRCRCRCRRRCSVWQETQEAGHCLLKVKHAALLQQLLLFLGVVAGLLAWNTGCVGRHIQRESLLHVHVIVHLLLASLPQLGHRKLCQQWGKMGMRMRKQLNKAKHTKRAEEQREQTHSPPECGWCWSCHETLGPSESASQVGALADTLDWQTATAAATAHLTRRWQDEAAAEAERGNRFCKHCACSRKMAS